MKKIAYLILVLSLTFLTRAYAENYYYDNKGNYWYESDDGTLFDNKGNYFYRSDSTYQDVLTGLGAVPKGAHPKTVLAGDENQVPGYYQTDPLSNMNRELKKLPRAPKEEKQTVEEWILEKIAKGETLTPGEEKIYSEVIRGTQSKESHKQETSLRK